MAAHDQRWNHNLHYHRLILDAVPGACEQALDVGCGEGTLARELRRIVPRVAAIDLHEPSIRLAMRHGGGVDYLIGDLQSDVFAPASFDFIASVAALHHMDARVALRRMRELLRPGGTLAILGLARSRYPADLPRDAAAAVVNRLYRTTKGYWEITSPIVWPPPETYARMRDLAAELLPGSRFRRHLLWRYSLVWTRPAA